MTILHSDDGAPETDEEKLKAIKRIKQLDNSIATGFSMATENGPLCLEPMIGVAFEIYDIAIDLGIDIDQGKLIFILLLIS